MPGAWWRVALLVSAVVLAVAPLPDTSVERLYATGAYRRLQPPLTTLSNVVPIALLDVLILAGGAWIVWRIRVHARNGTVPPGRRVLGFGLDAAALAALAYLSFLLLWGFNYRRASADVRFRVDASSISHERLLQASVQAREALNALYGSSTAARRPEEDRAELAAAFSRALERLPHSWRPVPGIPKRSAIAQLFPFGAIDGMMNPWGLEVLINPEVLPFERPFVIAHEWAHLAGYAAESDASFVAWLACLEGDSRLHYSGWLSIYLHLARALPHGDRVSAIAGLAPGPRRDITAIRERLQRAHPWVQGAAWRAYDQYLRANRVESGIANYDAVTRLVLGSAYARSHLTQP
jgi:hypothetical protein